MWETNCDMAVLDVKLDRIRVTVIRFHNFVHYLDIGIFTEMCADESALIQSQ
jgi:hypothetical protein